METKLIVRFRNDDDLKALGDKPVNNRKKLVPKRKPLPKKLPKKKLPKLGK